MRVGRGDSTRIRSAMWIASSTSCVMSRTVWRSFAQDAQQLVAHAQVHAARRAPRTARPCRGSRASRPARARAPRASACRPTARADSSLSKPFRPTMRRVVIGELRLLRRAWPLRPNIRFSRTVSHGNTEPCCEIRMPFELGLACAPRRRSTDRAAIGPDEARDDVHQRRLAAARGPDDRDELAVADAEARRRRRPAAQPCRSRSSS